MVENMCVVGLNTDGSLANVPNDVLTSEEISTPGFKLVVNALPVLSEFFNRMRDNGWRYLGTVPHPNPQLVTEDSAEEPSKEPSDTVYVFERVSN